MLSRKSNHPATRPRSRLNGGFTLIELMVTLVVVVVIISFGIPAMSDVLDRTRTTSQTNEFLTLVALARSEALNRQVRAAVLRSGGAWDGPLEVRFDSNRDGAVNVNDVLVRRIDGFDGTNIAVADAGGAAVTDIVFSGIGWATVAYDIDICRKGNIRAISIGRAGTVSTHASTAADCS